MLARQDTPELLGISQSDGLGKKIKPHFLRFEHSAFPTRTQPLFLAWRWCCFGFFFDFLFGGFLDFF
jgi:hypothetical protein